MNGDEYFWMEIIIGEGNNRFDKFNVIGDFDEISQLINFKHISSPEERIFCFKKIEDTEKDYKFINNMDDIYSEDGSYNLFQNPSIISLDKKLENDSTKYEIYIAIDNNGGLKYTISTDNIDIKKLMSDVTTSIKYGCLPIGEDLIIWVNGKIRAFKIETKQGKKKDVVDIIKEN